MHGFITNALVKHSYDRTIYWLSQEGVGKNNSSRLELAIVKKGETKTVLLAYA